MQYRADFWIGAVGVTLLNIVDLALLGVLLSHFKALATWSIWEIAFLYSMYLAALGLANTFTLHLTDVENYVRDGTLDQVLVRPSSPIVQLLGKQISHKDLTQLILGLTGMTISYQRLDLAWSGAEWMMLPVLLVTGALVLSEIVLILCSLAFWFTRSRVFLAGTAEVQEIVQHYPAHLFGPWFLGLVSLLLPFAFVNYYPTLALLGRSNEVPIAGLAFATPVVAFILFFLAAIVWKTGLRRYESTGS